MLLNAFRLKQSKKIISNKRRLVVYIHSYLVFRKLLKNTAVTMCCTLRESVEAMQTVS